MPTGSVDDVPARDAGTAQHERHAQQRVVAERSFEDHLVLAEELAVVGGDDHERVVGEPARRERVEHTTDRVVELGNHSVVARGHHCEVFARERRATGVRPLERPAARPGREQLVDRRLRVELVGVHLRQHFEHVVGGVAVAPRRGRVHRVMRVGEADPAEERTVDRAQPVARAVGDPRREVVFLGQRVAPRLAVVPHRATRLRLHLLDPLVAALRTVAEEVARVVQAERRRSVAPVPAAHQVGDAQVVTEQRELDVLEAEVRAVPTLVDTRRSLDRLDLAGGLERERRGEVRLAEQRGAVPGLPEQRRDRAIGRVGRQIDAVARHAVRRRVRAGEDRRARRLAERVLRARRGEARALGRERVEARRRAERRSLDAEGVGALLVGRDEEHVHRSG